jgi:single-strand DNA-binding protein
VNKVLLTGRLTRDPEMRALASGKHVTSFSVATNEYVGNGREKAEYHAVIAWERLADISAQYLGKGSMVAVEGRLQTRQWDDEAGRRHWKTEVVATAIEMLSGRRKKDYAAEALAAQAAGQGSDGTLDEIDEAAAAVAAAEPEADALEVAAVA